MSYVAGVLLALFLLASPRAAWAYSWMIRHDYTGCIQCHVDPNGAGLLTEYGRGQGETLLRTHYSAQAPDEEPGRMKDFLWGLFKSPDWLLLGGSLRPAVLSVSLPGQPLDTQLLLMEADLRAGIKIRGWRASASAGVISTSGSLAEIAGPVVAREYWGGYAWGDDTFMVRAGRMNVPFGIRSIEHPLWVRMLTRTDIDDQQEHGVAFDYAGTLVRASVMGILGNYQISPDAFRDRGYAGFVELAPFSRLALGVSSQVVHAEKDLDLGIADWRQAHGGYVRASPWRWLVLAAEADAIVHTTPVSAANATGLASMLQADVEPVQGLHLIATGETLSPGGVAPRSSFGAWGSVHWFFLPHADIRFDLIYRAQANGDAAPPGTPGGGPVTESSATIPITTFLTQLHVYL